MEHVIQIGVNVDDDTIARAIIDKASKEVSNAIFDNNGSYYNQRYSWTPRFERVIRDNVVEILEKNKDEIIRMASIEIANRAMRTKKIRDKVGEG